MAILDLLKTSAFGLKGNTPKSYDLKSAKLQKDFVKASKLEASQTPKKYLTDKK